MTHAAGRSLHVEVVDGLAGTLACVRLSGDIDISSEKELSVLAAQLAGYQTVYLDLARVAFAGSALVHFLVALVHALPAKACLLVCRPQPMTLTLMNVTSVDLLIPVRADLPVGWLTKPFHDSHGNRTPV